LGPARAHPLARRFPRRHEDARQLVGFSHEGLGGSQPHDLGVHKYLEPVRALVRLLDCHPELRDELSIGPGAANGPVVRADTCAGAKKLRSDYSTFFRTRDRAAESDNGYRELSGSELEGVGSHAQS